MKNFKPRSRQQAVNRLVARLDGLDRLAALADGLTSVERRQAFETYLEKMIVKVQRDLQRDLKGFK